MLGFKKTQKVARRAHYSHGHVIAVYKHRHQDEKGRWLGGINHGWHLKAVKTRSVPHGFEFRGDHYECTFTGNKFYSDGNPGFAFDSGMNIEITGCHP